MQKKFEALDFDKSNSLELNELLAAVVETMLRDRQERLWSAFKMLDDNQDGFVTADELASNLAKVNLGSIDPHGDLGDIESLIKEVDTNADGRIEWEEFVRALNGVPDDQELEEGKKTE